MRIMYTEEETKEAKLAPKSDDATIFDFVE